MCKLILIPVNKASFDYANLKEIINCMPAECKPKLEDLIQFKYGNIILDISKQNIDAAAARILNRLSDAFSVQYG